MNSCLYDTKEIIEFYLIDRSPPNNVGYLVCQIVYPVLQCFTGCVDLYPTYCPRIMGTTLCMSPEYHRVCCMSCAGAD